MEAANREGIVPPIWQEMVILKGEWEGGELDYSCFLSFLSGSL